MLGKGGEHNGSDGDDAVEERQVEQPIDLGVVPDGLSEPEVTSESHFEVLDRNSETEEVFRNVDQVVSWLDEDIVEGRLSRFQTDEEKGVALDLIDDWFVNMVCSVFHEINVQRKAMGFDQELFMDDYVHTIYNLLDTYYLHKDRDRGTGDNYFRSHIVGVLMGCIKDGGFTGPVMRTGAVVHDNVEDVNEHLFNLVNLGEYQHRLSHLTEESKKQFSIRLRNVVTGLTKVLRAAQGMESATKDEQRRAVQEETRYMLLRMFLREVKTIPLKLHDRVHNMETLDGKDGDPDAQMRIARETEEDYCNFARILKMDVVGRKLDYWVLYYLNPGFLMEFEKLQDRQTVMLEDCAEEIKHDLMSITSVETAFFRNVSVSEYMESIDKPRFNIEMEDLRINSLDSMQQIVVFVNEGDKDLLSLVTSYIDGIFDLKPVEAVKRGNGVSLVGFSQRFKKQLSFRVITRVDYNRERRGVFVEGGEDELGKLKDQVRSLTDRYKAGSIKSIIEACRVELFKAPVKVCTPMGDEYEFPIGASYLDFLAAVNPAELIMSDFVDRFRTLCSHTVESQHVIRDPIERPSDPDEVPVFEVKTIDEKLMGSPNDMVVSPLDLLYCATVKAEVAIKRILRSPSKYYRKKFPDKWNQSFDDDYDRQFGITRGDEYMSLLSGILNTSSSRFLTFVRKFEEASKAEMLKKQMRGVTSPDRVTNLIERFEEEHMVDVSKKAVGGYYRISIKPDDLKYGIGVGGVNPLKELVSSFEKIDPGEVDSFGKFFVSLGKRNRWNLSLSLPNRPGVMRRFSMEFEKLGLSLGDLKTRRRGDVDVCKMFVSKPHASADPKIDTYEFFKLLIRLQCTFPDLRITDSLFG